MDHLYSKPAFYLTQWMILLLPIALLSQSQCSQATAQKRTIKAHNMQLFNSIQTKSSPNTRREWIKNGTKSLCNCRNESPCDVTNGFCPDGCQVGWVRADISGPCVHQKDQHLSPDSNEAKNSADSLDVPLAGVKTSSVSVKEGDIYEGEIPHQIIIKRSGASLGELPRPINSIRIERSVKKLPHSIDPKRNGNHKNRELPSSPITVKRRKSFTADLFSSSQIIPIRGKRSAKDHFSHSSTADGNGRKRDQTLTFYPETTCYQRDRKMTGLSWRVDLSVDYIVRMVSLTFETKFDNFFKGSGSSEVNLDLQWRPGKTINQESTKCRLPQDSNPHYSKCELLTKSESIANFVDIKIRDSAQIPDNQLCTSPVNVTRVVVTGIPICPPLHRGNRCQDICSCSGFCGDDLCDAVTATTADNCQEDETTAICTPGFYGEHCQKECPKNCNIGPIKGCHIMNGTCNTCSVVASKLFQSHCPKAYSKVASSPSDVEQQCGSEIKDVWLKAIKSLSSNPLNTGQRRSAADVEDEEDMEDLLDDKAEEESEHHHEDEVAEETEEMRKEKEWLESSGARGVALIAAIIIFVGFCVALLYACVVYQLCKKHNWRRERRSTQSTTWKERMSLRTDDGFDADFKDIQKSMKSIHDLNTITAARWGEKNTSRPQSFQGRSSVVFADKVSTAKA